MNRLFERPDRGEATLVPSDGNEPNLERALENFRHCLERINTLAVYDEFLHSEFRVILKDERRMVKEPLVSVEQAFYLI